MPIYEWRGFNAKKAKFEKGTTRAKDSKEAMDNVLYKKFGGSGEVTVWPKRKENNGEEVQRAKKRSGTKKTKGSKAGSTVSN